MIKKIALTTLLLSTLASAEMSQKGFFVGLDGSTLSSNIAYAKKGSAITTSNYASDESITPISLRLGYQYYFTRIYGRVSSEHEYKDNTKEPGRFKIKNQVFELNADYLPTFYKADSKSWFIRGVFGVGIGANKSALTYYDSKLDSIGNNLTPILSKETQWNMEYGYQLGALMEFDFGLSTELGYRFRSGLMAEFSDADEANQATFKLRTEEIYIGINYLF